MHKTFYISYWLYLESTNTLMYNYNVTIKCGHGPKDIISLFKQQLA